MSQRPSFYFIAASDTELLKEKIGEVEENFSAPDTVWKKSVFWGDNPPDDVFWNALNQQGLFTENKWIVIRKANEWNSDTWKILSNNLGHISGTVFPIICLEVEYDKKKFKIPAHIIKSKCFEYARKKGWLAEIPSLSSQSLRKFIEKCLQGKNLTASKEVIDKLVQILKPDAGIIKNEIDKLSLFLSEKKVTLNALEHLSAYSEENIFQLISSIEQGNLSALWKGILQNSQTQLLFPFISLMGRELRLLWQMENGEAPPYPVWDSNQKQKYARKLGKQGIADAFSSIAEAEWNVKSGKLSPEQALEKLVLSLFQKFNGQLS